MRDHIIKKLPNVNPLLRETVEWLCAYNNVRQTEGNSAAHKASQEEIHHAVMLLQSNAKDAGRLEELYQFVYSDPTPI